MRRGVLDRPTGAWISESQRLEYNTRRAHRDGPPAKDETEHFYLCEGCGQAVDMRLLGDVLYHDQIEHKPLRVN